MHRTAELELSENRRININDDGTYTLTQYGPKDSIGITPVSIQVTAQDIAGIVGYALVPCVAEQGEAA